MCGGNMMCGGHVMCGGFVNRVYSVVPDDNYLSPDLPILKKERILDSETIGFVRPGFPSANEILCTNRRTKVSPNNELYQKIKEFVCIKYGTVAEVALLMDMENKTNCIYNVEKKEIRKLQKSNDCKLYGIRVDSDLDVTIRVKEAIKIMKENGLDKKFNLKTIEHDLRDAKEELEYERDY